MHCACEKLGDDEIRLSLAPHNQYVFKEARLDDIKAAMSTLFKRPMSVKLEIEESDRETPAECLARLGVQQLEQTRDSLQKEPGLQALMSEFDAQIDQSSVEPYAVDSSRGDKL